MFVKKDGEKLYSLELHWRRNSQAEEKQEKYRLRLKVHDKADEAVPCNGFRYLVELRFSRK